MIIKRRSKPLVLRKLEAAIPRLPQNFPRLQEMKEEISIRFKGYIGEQKVDYQLEQLPRKFTVLHDVYLKSHGCKKFQIDSQVISNNALYIIVVKNLNSTITFNTILNQFTRTDGNKEEGFVTKTPN